VWWSWVRIRTSTVALRDAESDEKGIRCLGVKLNHTVTGEHKYRGVVVQVGVEPKFGDLVI
jgi:hypothetical protein